MLGVPCRYDEAQHQLLTPPLLDWCRLQTSDPDIRDNLFVYLQRLYGTFVIARWVDKPLGLFVDVLNLGYSLSNFNREAAQELRRRILAPVTAYETSQAMGQGTSDYLHERQNSNDRLAENITRRKSTKISVSMAGDR